MVALRVEMTISWRLEGQHSLKRNIVVGRPVAFCQGKVAEGNLQRYHAPCLHTVVLVADQSVLGQLFSFAKVQIVKCWH